MEMCAGALIPRRTLSRPIRSTWISISFPMISFSSFFRVTTSIETLFGFHPGGNSTFTGFRMTWAHHSGKPDIGQALYKRLPNGEARISENDLFSDHIV